MSRTHLEMMANLLVVLYLVTHGVSVPAEGRGHLASGFYLSARAWIAGYSGWPAGAPGVKEISATGSLSDRAAGNT